MAVLNGTSSNDYTSIWSDTSDSVLMAAGSVKNTGSDNYINVKCIYTTVSEDGYHYIELSIPPTQIWSFETISTQGKLLALAAASGITVVAQHFTSLEIQIKSTIDDAHSDYSLLVKVVPD